MTLGHVLQLAGGIFELAGLGAVAFGISETRQAFTDRQSLASRFVSAVKRLVGRLTALFVRKRPKTVEIGTAVETSAAMSVRAQLIIGDWGGLPLEQKLERLQTRSNQHEEMIGHLDDKLARESEARRAAEVLDHVEREKLKQLLEERIRHAAAGGLRLETLGVSALAIGLILGTWGSLIV